MPERKELEIEDSLFRIAKYRPEDLTEEEVTSSKEKKICLRCKGKVLRFNAYLCPKCEAFYCADCARTLVKSENMCWSCKGPIDTSKPVKPKEIIEQETEIEAP